MPTGSYMPAALVAARRSSGDAVLRENHSTNRFLAGLEVCLCVAVIGFGLNRFSGHPHISPAAMIFNDLIIGAIAAALALFFVARQGRMHERAASEERARQEGILKERSRIGREFHDGLAQYLAGVILQLEAAKESFDQSSDTGKHERRALELAREGLRETRRSLQGMLPETLETDGLSGAIARMGKELTAETPLDLQLSFSGAVRELSADREKALLRIGREALANIVKHANAQHAQVRLSFGKQEVRLCITDDGQGFQTGPHSAGFGLRSMEERTKVLNGSLSIRSERGRGTQLEASIPIPPSA